MPTLSFHPGYGGILLLGVAGGAMMLVAIFYARAYRALRPGQWTLLYLLRLAAIAMVLMLLFRPVLSFQQEQVQRRGVVMLVDRSASMGIADDAAGGTRLEQAADRVSLWVRKLSRDFDTHVIAFSELPVPLGTLEEISRLQPAGSATSLSRALEAAAKMKAARDIEAVFLLSDGVHNSGGDPLASARKLGLPIDTIGIGSALRDRAAGDIRITGLDVPDEMPVQHLARIKAYVDAVAFAGRVVRGALEEDGQQVAERELVLDDTEGPQELTFEFTPAVKGVHTYTVKVPAAAEERIPQNNARSASSLVVEARIRVLYIEGTLRAEYGAIVGRFLSKDPNIEYCALVQTRPNVFMHRSNIAGLELKTIPQGQAEIDRFSVFILGDIDSSYLRPAQMQLIRDRVHRGAGLLMIGGYHSLGPGGYQDTPLAEVLPVFLGERDIGQITEPFTPQLTAAGRQHPVFANIAQFFPGMGREAEISGLPPLEGSVRVRGARPGASILAVHPNERAGESPMPVLAVQPWGEGRAAVFTADTTRSWHQMLRTLDRETPFLRFWGQVVRWLANRGEDVKAAAGITATTDRASYEPESPITISAVVRGNEGEAVPGARVTATIQGPGNAAREVTLSPAEGPGGHFRAAFSPEQPGRYQITITARHEEQVWQADPLQVDVGRPNLEFERLNLDEKMLVALASQSGGQYAHIRTADRLVERLQRRQERRKVQREIPLARPPLLWGTFVAALTAEWLLRRRYLLR